MYDKPIYLNKWEEQKNIKQKKRKSALNVSEPKHIIGIIKKSKI
jgi:predicted XRE-type DNA-binding protein